jgi:large subunit ribosomal protein L35
MVVAPIAACYHIGLKVILFWKLKRFPYFAAKTGLHPPYNHAIRSSHYVAGEGHAESRCHRSNIKETEMPKMKTKSSCKKRFKVTATGRVKTAQAGKRHGMIKRTNKFLRNARGTTVMSTPDEKIIKSMMPYAR